MIGWIKVHRKLWEWEWYKDSQMVHLFIHCLLKANHEPNYWKGIKVETGQFVTGRKVLSFETGISEQSLRTCLKRLKSTNNLTIKSTSKYSIVTICNYSTYQTTIKEINQQINQQTDIQLTSNQPAINQQLTTNKKDKNLKNEKNEKKKAICVDVLNHFNLQSGKNYTLTPERKRIIIINLNKKRTAEQMKAAIDKFVKDDWEDRYKFMDLVYCIGVRNSIDNFEKWAESKEVLSLQDRIDRGLVK